ncbi:hypothetical protein GH714_023245 [Hevea brasiliensis]|uniref:PIFI-like Ig-like domain-containing protein n=1 Tax=Hevea brasiliensis TaxID=3981 RepID=A0A6A6LK18_HEVBR|nr:hypothetical protein GH714_023245 [Hevea brasiliensis]
MASTSASRFKLPTQTFSAMRSIGNTKANPSVSNSLGQKLKLFYNPAATKLDPNEDFGIAFNGPGTKLSKEGACERAIFPDANIVVTRCAMIGNLSIERGDRCSLDLVPGCMDPSSHLYYPLANVDDGSCPIDSDLGD